MVMVGTETMPLPASAPAVIDSVIADAIKARAKAGTSFGRAISGQQQLIGLKPAADSDCFSDAGSEQSEQSDVFFLDEPLSEDESPRALSPAPPDAAPPPLTATHDAPLFDFDWAS